MKNSRKEGLRVFNQKEIGGNKKGLRQGEMTTVYYWLSM